MQNAELIESGDAPKTGQIFDIETDDIETDETSKEEDEIGLYLDTYEVSVVPNDFNIRSLCDYLDEGTLSVPEFQRGYVWNKKQASRFVESLLMGLPVPQIFLFEKGRNDLWVIDGQQRLMSIYFFAKGRFPRAGKMHHAENVKSLSLEDDAMFSDFRLELKSDTSEDKSPLHGKSIHQLGKEKERGFFLAPFRSMVVRQYKPDNNSDVAYEIFHRLNTGGKNLTSQQIRNCVYESKFLDMVRDLNLNDLRWRKIIGHKTPVATQRDEEMVMRAFAMLLTEEQYASPLTRFLNRFAASKRKSSDEDIRFWRTLFERFLDACESKAEVFSLSEKGGFRYLLFEAVFVALLSDFARKQKLPEQLSLPADKVRELLKDTRFSEAQFSGSARVENVKIRLAAARRIILAND